MSCNDDITSFMAFVKGEGVNLPLPGDGGIGEGGAGV